MSEVRILLGAPFKNKGLRRKSVAPCFFVRPHFTAILPLFPFVAPKKQQDFPRGHLDPCWVFWVNVRGHRRGTADCPVATIA
jgi:hypothetical protein